MIGWEIEGVKSGKPPRGSTTNSRIATRPVRSVPLLVETDSVLDRTGGDARRSAPVARVAFNHYTQHTMDYPTCCKYGHLLNDITTSGKDPGGLLKNTHQDVADVAIPYLLKHHLIEEHRGYPDRAPQRFTLTPAGQALLATYRAHLPMGGCYDGNTTFNMSPPKVSEQDLVDAFPECNS